MIFILVILAALFLAFFLTPILIWKNKKILKEMEVLIEEFGALRIDDRDERRGEYVRRLTDLKAKIYIGDKASVERSRDLIASFR